MKTQFSVAAIVFCGAVSPSWAVQARVEAVASPAVSGEAFRAPENIGQIPTAALGSDLPQQAPVFAAAPAPETLAASALPPENESPAAEAGAPAGSESILNRPASAAVANTSRNASRPTPRRRGTAAAQAAAALAKPKETMDGARADQDDGSDDYMGAMYAMDSALRCLYAGSTGKCGSDAVELANFKAAAQAAEKYFAKPSNISNENERHQYAQAFIQLNTALNHLGNAVSANDAAAKAKALQETSAAMDTGHSLPSSTDEVPPHPTSADPLVQAAMSYQTTDQLMPDTIESGPRAAQEKRKGDLTGQALADFISWSGKSNASAPVVYEVRLHDAAGTVVRCMYQVLSGVAISGGGTNFSFYTPAGKQIVFGSVTQDGAERFNQYLNPQLRPLFAVPSPSDPAGDGAPLSPAQIATLTETIKLGVSNTSGYNDLSLQFAAPADPGILKGAALALHDQWASDPVSALTPPMGEPADVEKPRVFRTTLRVGDAATPMIYLIQLKLLAPTAPVWTDFAYFTLSGQLIVEGTYNGRLGGLKWGQLTDPSTGQ